MTCNEARPLLHAYLDGELDLTASLQIEQHLESCDGCAGAYRKLEALRAEIVDANLDFASDAALVRVRASIERSTGSRTTRAWWSGWHIPAWTAAAAILILAIFIPARFIGRRALTDQELVDSHLRSLLGAHLIDIPSSDRHTVKPWFQGKLEFAPPVPDLTAKGFVLVGGRLDVIDTHKAAALVYKRGEHIINLWVSQGNDAASAVEQSEVDGYHLIRWSADGMTFRAVSDVEVGELRAFATAMRSQ